MYGHMNVKFDNHNSSKLLFRFLDVVKIYVSPYWL